jgi:hypothetical protein
MAQTSWPFENIDTSETQFSLWARNLGQGVIDGKLLELEPFGDGSGMNVKVKSGQALVRGHFYDSTVQETLNIAAADASLPRKDAVTLRLDPTLNSILLHVITGTPNASPSLPALTQTDGGIYDLLVAEVNVPAAAVVISSGNVVDRRTIFQPYTGQPTSIAIADVTGLQTELNSINSEIDTKQDILSAVSTKTGAYTLAVGDTNDLIQANGTFTITVPASTFGTGARVDVVNTGTGVITFAGSGLTISSKDAKVTIGKQFAAATLFFTSSTTAILVGDLA